MSASCSRKKIFEITGKENQPATELPESRIQELEEALSLERTKNENLKQANDELKDLVKKYVASMEWMEKRIKALEAEVSRLAAKAGESDSSSSNSPPLIKK